MWWGVLVACLGGFLFGFYMAVVSGALLFISSEFHFSLAEESAFVSILLLGAILGSSTGGYFTDWLGRKKALWSASCFLILGTLTLVSSKIYVVLLFARILQGIGIGVISVAVPLYLGEIAPIAKRGRAVSAYQLIMGLGILVAYIVNYSFTSTAHWQAMFLWGIFPALAFVIFLFFIPESPVWLFRKKQDLLAFQALQRLGLPSVEAPQLEKVIVRSKVLSFLCMIGILLSAFQQLTGINTVIYYAPRIFGEAGYTSSVSAVFATIILGIANLLGSWLSVWLLDRVGRKKLLLFGIVGMFIGLVSLSVFSFYEVSFIDKVSVASLLLYIFCFAMGPGPVVWVLLSEIYPPQIRDRAMSYSLLANWVCVYGILWTFPYLLQNMRIEGTFALYALLNVLGFLFIFKCFPETKQKGFQEIVNEFDKKLQD